MSAAPVAPPQTSSEPRPVCPLSGTLETNNHIDTQAFPQTERAEERTETESKDMKAKERQRGGQLTPQHGERPTILLIRILKDVNKYVRMYNNICSLSRS